MLNFQYPASQSLALSKFIWTGEACDSEKKNYFENMNNQRVLSQLS